MITNPSLVVEVLSPSTEAWDRGGKFVQYRTVASAVRRLARLGVDLPLAHIYRTVDGLNAESPRSA